MLTSILAVWSGIACGAADDPPAKLELFAKEGWYKSQKGAEKDFVGVLHKVDKKKGVVGIGRFNPYFLVMEVDGKPATREVYVGGKPDILTPYVGKKIKLTGKAVELEVIGKVHHEIWPARLEVVADKKKAEAPNRQDIQVEEAVELFNTAALAQDKKEKELKIVARAIWRYASASPKGPKEGHKLVLRSAAELVAATPFKNLDAPQQVVEKQATAELAKALKVDGIDWKTHMLVVVTAGVKPTGGYSVDIQSITVADKTATVAWKLNTPKGAATQAFTHPGQVALVERFDGEVKFTGGAAPKRQPEAKDAPAAQRIEENTEKLLKAANQALKDGDKAKALELAAKAVPADEKAVLPYYYRGTLYEALEEYAKSVADFTRAIELDPKAADGYQLRGLVQFKAGKVKESIRDFDRYIELRPEAQVSHWQRGISYYYVGRFDDGAKQFEGYQEFDSNDVENAVWRYLCMARKDGVAKARAAMLKIGDDKRVPMRQIYDLYAGTLKPADVLIAAEEGNPDKAQLNRRLFYAHLYLGLYYETEGDAKRALEHITKAANDHRIGHYMWDVARVHRDLLVQNGKAK